MIRRKSSMEITRREVIASITIIAIMLLLGVVIAGRISEAMMDENEKYNKATKIETADLFRYGMDTSIGNAFVYGELKAVDAVTFPDIGGSHLSATKVTEKYTMHTRTVTKTVNGKTTTSVQTYWTWDRVHTEKIKAKKITFCGIEFDYSQFTELDETYVDTVPGSYHIRYVYYASSVQAKGTIFADLMNKNLGEGGARFFKNMTIAETVDYLESSSGLIAFWIVWIIFTGCAVYGFYYLDNRWLYK
jgi:hypothetical protein